MQGLPGLEHQPAGREVQEKERRESCNSPPGSKSRARGAILHPAAWACLLTYLPPCNPAGLGDGPERGSQPGGGVAPEERAGGRADRHPRPGLPPGWREGERRGAQRRVEGGVEEVSLHPRRRGWALQQRKAECAKGGGRRREMRAGAMGVGGGMRSWPLIARPHLYCMHHPTGICLGPEQCTRGSGT